MSGFKILDLFLQSLLMNLNQNKLAYECSVSSGYQVSQGWVRYRMNSTQPWDGEWYYQGCVITDKSIKVALRCKQVKRICKMVKNLSFKLKILKALC